MVINKIGQQHIDYGVNCQDYGIVNNSFKLVCDGCSEGKHSEVGAKTFCHLFEQSILNVPDEATHQEYVSELTRKIFNEYLLPAYGQTAESIKNHLCFTIMVVHEKTDSFVVSYCGDGYIIKQKQSGDILFEEITDGEYPKYFVYNYVDKEHLSNYVDGVDFTTVAFSKEEYSNIGIASDGLRFIDKNPENRGEFIELLKNNKSVALKRLINKHQPIFKDDITIIF